MEHNGHDRTVLCHGCGQWVDEGQWDKKFKIVERPAEAAQEAVIPARTDETINQTGERKMNLRATVLAALEQAGMEGARTGDLTRATGLPAKQCLVVTQGLLEKGLIERTGRKPYTWKIKAPTAGQGTSSAPESAGPKNTVQERDRTNVKEKMQPPDDAYDLTICEIEYGEEGVNHETGRVRYLSIRAELRNGTGVASAFGELVRMVRERLNTEIGTSATRHG